MIISGALVLDPTYDNGNNPLIGWQNLVTIANVAAGTAVAGYPASNLANPATYSEWRAADGSIQYLTVTLDGLTDIDYVAIAAHNFGSGRILPSIEVLYSGVWTEVIPAVMLADDAPLLWRLPLQQGPSGIRIKLSPTAVAPRAAVLYVGKLLVCQRRMYVGHVPLPQGLQYSVTNGMSESGNFLGRIVTGAWRSSSIFFRLISPAWHRANTVPFLAAVKDTPFFFAWRPADYPMEIGYCWLSGSPPVPVPVQADGNLIAFQLDVQGVT